MAQPVSTLQVRPQLQWSLQTGDFSARRIEVDSSLQQKKRHVIQAMTIENPLIGSKMGG